MWTIILVLLLILSVAGLMWYMVLKMDDEKLNRIYKYISNYHYPDFWH